MPDWFFYSCVLGYPVACLLVWGLVRLCFKDMPLDAGDAQTEEGVGRVTGGQAEENRP